MTPIFPTEIDWKKAKGMRDIITHHYFDIDSETVFVVCSEHIPEMGRVIKKILEDLEIESEK
ncbi:MAG: HepT-like ribonuclease domain-containing protein [Candidatus Scalindua sp.]